MNQPIDDNICAFIEVVILIDPTAKYSGESGLSSSLPENLLSSLLDATTKSRQYITDLAGQLNETTH